MKRMLSNLKSKLLIAMSTMSLFATNVFATETTGGQLGTQAGCKMEKGVLVCDVIDKNLNEDTIWNTIFDSVQGIVTGVSGVLTIIMVLLFIWKAFNFAKSSDNPSERSKCVTGMIVYCIAAALFGASTVIVGLMFGVFSSL